MDTEEEAPLKNRCVDCPGEGDYALGVDVVETGESEVDEDEALYVYREEKNFEPAQHTRARIENMLNHFK
jgi:hypothetical protein